MKQRLFGIIMILALMYQPVLVAAQGTLVFSAVEETHPAKTVGEILRRAYQRIGIQIEILELPGKRGLIYSNGGETDGEVCRTEGIGAEYTNLRRIDVAVRVDEMYLFVKRGNEFSVEGWESISKDIIIGYQRGVNFIETNTAKYGIKTWPANNSEQLFKMLAAGGRVGAIIDGFTMGSRIIKEHGLQEIVRLNSPIHTSVLYHYLHKKHAHLVPQITAVLKEMEVSGELQEISQNAELSQ